MKETSGFIALTSVLILSALFLSITISIASRAIAGTVSEASLQERDTAQYQAEACLQHAIIELQRTFDYDGDDGILIGSGTCEVLPILGDGSANRVVQVQSTVGEHTYRIEAHIESISPRLTIRSIKREESF